MMKTTTINDWFDFGHRVTGETTLVKMIDGQPDVKVVKAGFNWLAVLFNWLYVLVSAKYQTPGFRQKFLIRFFGATAVVALVTIILGQLLGMLLGLAMEVWIGLLFDTWFKNQLLANGYHVQVAATASPTNLN